MSKAKTRSTPLLELLDSRWNEFIKDMPDPTPERPAARPHLVGKYGQAVKQALEMTRQVERSDPFALRRTSHYIKQGYLNAHDVIKDTGAIIRLKQEAKLASRAA